MIYLNINSKAVSKIYSYIISRSSDRNVRSYFQSITTNRLLTPSIMGLDSVYLFVKVLPIFILGEQATVVTNIYLNFLITLIAMVLFIAAISSYI